MTGVQTCALPISSHERLAELASTTRPRVTVLINEFKRGGYVLERGDELLVTPRLADVLAVDVAGTRGHGGIDHLQQLLVSLGRGSYPDVETRVR